MGDQGVSVVKVCGLRELPHMLAAAQAGAGLLGMVFVPGVRRRVDREAAQSLVAAFRESYPERPKIVGLFADQPVEEVNGTAQFVGLDWIQLCGQEGPDFWARMERPFLQVLHVPDPPISGNTAVVDNVVVGPEALMRDYRSGTLALIEGRLHALERGGGLAILDRQSEKQPGGVGQSFDWTLARELADQRYRFLLAGGLTPENVGKAIEVAHPYGIDVSSGVETDGVKDPEKIRAFVRAARGGADSPEKAERQGA